MNSYAYKGYKSKEIVSGEVTAKDRRHAMEIIKTSYGLDVVIELKNKVDYFAYLSSVIRVINNAINTIKTKFAGAPVLIRKRSVFSDEKGNFEFIKEPLPKSPQKNKVTVPAKRVVEKKIAIDIKRLKPNNKITIHKKELLFFFSRMAALLQADVSLLKTIDLIQENVRNKNFIKILEYMQEDIRSGEQLSTSMTRFPRVFSDLHISVVAAGEQTGTRAKTFADLEVFIKQQHDAEKKIKTLTIYPSIVFSVIIVLLLAGSKFFVPLFRELFEDMNADIPTLTQYVFFVADYIHYPILVILGVWFLDKTLGRFSMFKDRLKRIKDTILIKIPICKNYILAVSLYYYTNTMMIMLQNGVPILHSLETSSNTIPNSSIRHTFAPVIHDAADGMRLSEAYRQYGVDNILTEMVSVGEETGKLADSFSRIAEYYYGNLKNQIEVFIQLLQPVMIVLLASIILPVLFGIFVPLMRISSGEFL